MRILRKREKRKRIRMKKKERGKTTGGEKKNLIPPSLSMRIPLILGNLEVWGYIDSCCDFFLVKRELWEKLKGEKVEGNARFKGVSGVMLFEKYDKKVELEVSDYSFDVLVYPMDVEGDDVAALIPWNMAEKFGVRLEVPKCLESSWGEVKKGYAEREEKESRVKEEEV